MSYFNSTSLSGEDLKQAVSVAKDQTQAVKLIYSCGKALSPLTVWNCMLKAGHQSLLTSIRRSINTLEKDGYLQKTGIMVQGKYGRPENTWQLKK